MEALAQKIRSVEELQGVVRTMRALAAANIRQYERAVESLRDYYRTVELGLQALLQQNQEVGRLVNPGKTERLLAVIIGTDYGFAGQFNDEIVNFSLSFLQEIEAKGIRTEIIVIGEQAFKRLEGVRQEEVTFYNVPSSLAGINPLMQQLVFAMEKRKVGKVLDEVVLLYNKSETQMDFTPQKVQLLPVELGHYKEKAQEWPTKTIPAFTEEPAQLLKALIDEYIYVNLYRALALSMAAENACRLAMMQAAVKKIGEVNDTLVLQYQQGRQNMTTAELLDIISGFEALTQLDSGSGQQGF